jgi:hypothetical protein
MFNRKSFVAVALVGITAMILLAGGMAVASNTGFKLNKSLAPALPAPANPQAGNNWLSIPYFNPYGNFGNFCTQVGLISAGLTKATAVVVDPVTGVTSAAVQCGTAGATALTLTPGRGIRVRNTPTSVVGTPTSIIIVGSHDPSLSITVPKSGAGTTGDFWFAVPYHTTAANAGDLCLSSGLSSTGLSKATITRLDPVTGVTAAAVQCGTPGATSFILTLGEAIKIREPNGPLSFVPAHF